MQTFKTFFESAEPLGLTELIKIDGVGDVTAKVDSGNGAYNVLHGINIDQKGDNVTFTTIDNKKITKPVVELIDINIGSGNIEKRPVVVFDVIIKNKPYKNIKFSIADREQNEEKVLLGKEFISDLGGIIDVNK